MNLINDLKKNNDLTGVNIVNLTPHGVTIYLNEFERLVFNPSGIIAKVKPTGGMLGIVNSVLLMNNCFNDIENLPEEKENTIYIVSALVLTANAESTKPRTDLISPSTDPSAAVIDKNGQIIGLKRFTTR